MVQGLHEASGPGQEWRPAGSHTVVHLNLMNTEVSSTRVEKLTCRKTQQDMKKEREKYLQVSGSFLYSDYTLKTLEGQVVETGREGRGGGQSRGRRWEGGRGRARDAGGVEVLPQVHPAQSTLTRDGLDLPVHSQLPHRAPSPGSRTGCKHISPHLLLPEVWLGFQVILRRHALPASSSFWSLISNTFLRVAPAASLFRAPSQMHRGLFPCKHIFWDDTTALKSA